MNATKENQGMHIKICLMVLVVCIVTMQAMTIKLGSLAPSGSPWDTGLRRLAAQWSKISGGRITLKIYPGGIAGNEEDMLRKIRIGQLDAAGITGMGLQRVFNGIMAMQLPLTIQNDEELWYVLNHMKPTFEKELQKKNFKVIIWTKVGWGHFFSKKPVIVPDDLRNQKQFVYAGDSDGIQAWKEAGFNPVALNVTDLMSALQSGMVEAFTMTPLSAVAYQWYQFADNMCGLRWAPLIGGILVSTRTWEKIDPAIREELLTASEKIGKDMQMAIDQADAEAVTQMKQQGLTVHPVTDQQRILWKKETEVGFEKLAGKTFDEASYAEVVRYLEAYRKDQQESDAKETGPAE